MLYVYCDQMPALLFSLTTPVWLRLAALAQSSCQVTQIKEYIK